MRQVRGWIDSYSCYLEKLMQDDFSYVVWHGVLCCTGAGIAVAGWLLMWTYIQPLFHQQTTSRPIVLEVRDNSIIR